jgi:hypothetical protein
MDVDENSRHQRFIAYIRDCYTVDPEGIIRQYAGLYFSARLGIYQPARSN